MHLTCALLGSGRRGVLIHLASAQYSHLAPIGSVTQCKFSAVGYSDRHPGALGLRGESGIRGRINKLGGGTQSADE